MANWYIKPNLLTPDPPEGLNKRSNRSQKVTMKPVPELKGIGSLYINFQIVYQFRKIYNL